ncbi:alpha-(1,3)-fucosyltransferase 7 [Menidia menidia]
MAAVTTIGTKALGLFFLLLLLLASLSTLLYNGLLDRDPSGQRARPPAVQRNVSVLLWHWPFGRSYRLDGSECLRMYAIDRCLLTDRRSSLPSADVVVFHHQELGAGRSALPLDLPRPPSQRWVWLSLEPPAHNAGLDKLSGLFNWTMSYRRDADIPVPYGESFRGAFRPSIPPAKNRSCFASWVVSKYFPGQTRSRVYQSLRKHVPIEVYGKWNRRPLADQKLLPTTGNCLFYLAFENSEAKDYISEKLWRNAFQAGALPVVLGPGPATYRALAPPRSFIHVADFPTAGDLAAHLKRLASDKKAYEEYFHWHHTHGIKRYTDWRQRLCQICVKYPSLTTPKVYQDLEGWVNS